jgi:hypothetical protein
MDFQSIALHMIYNFQHFELIEYVNGLFWSLLIFQANDPKVHLYNENFDFTLMEILKNNYNSQLQYVISLFKIYCNTNITKNQINNHIQYL